MDIIQFIEKDIKRDNKNSSVFYVTVFLIVTLLPSALGIFLRDEHIIVWEYRTFVFNALAAVLLGSSAILFYRRQNFSAKWNHWAWLFISFSILFSVKRLFFPSENLRTVYQSMTQFWTETILCFEKGSFATLALGGTLIVFSFMLSSTPNRKRRFLTSLIAGMASLVMLGFHCDSSSIGHIFLGHLGPGVVCGVLLFILQEGLFYFKIRSQFSFSKNQIKNILKIG